MGLIYGRSPVTAAAVNVFKGDAKRHRRYAITVFQTKLSNDVAELDILDRPKTPQAPEPQPTKEPNFPPTLPFPFFPTFPPAPGLIPHPMFPRFPLPLGRGGTGPHPAMPNLPLPPRFLNLPVKSEDLTSLSKSKSLEREKPAAPSSAEITSSMTKHEKSEKEKEDKTKTVKLDKEILPPVPASTVAPPLQSALSAPITYPSTPVPIVPLLPSKGPKVEKPDKNDKVIFQFTTYLPFIFCIATTGRKFILNIQNSVFVFVSFSALFDVFVSFPFNNIQYI